MAQAAIPMQQATPVLDLQKVIHRLFEIMDSLLAVVDRETVLVRAGKLSEARPLEQEKSDLAQQYMAIAKYLKDSNGVAALAPAPREDLRQRHDLFHALLQINLTVLATAHAVSEGIMRGVSDELTRKAAPQTYGASGRQTMPSPMTAQPLAVSRVL